MIHVSKEMSAPTSSQAHTVLDITHQAERSQSKAQEQRKAQDASQPAQLHSSSYSFTRSWYAAAVPTQ